MEKRNLFWITMPSCGHFKGLEVKYGLVEEKNMTDNIYFDDEKSANLFLIKLQKFIQNEYIPAKSWF
jgi:hypothetical protein